MQNDFYRLLNIPPDATQDEIRAAYFDAAKRLHPDINPEKEARQRFLMIQDAYEILANPSKRKTYDSGLPDTFKETAAVNYFSQYSQSVVPVLGEAQLFYTLLEMECTKGLNPQDLPPVHICLVVDRSTSMRGERMDMVRSNISKLVRSLRSKDKISIVAFSDRAEVIVPATEVNEPYQIDSILNQLSVGGSTEIFQGLSAGLDTIHRFSNNNHFKHLLLITDGQTYGDEAACLDLATTANYEGISINGLGIGEDWNDIFLDQLASASGGNSIYIRNSEDLQNFIEQKMKSINVSYAQKLELHYELEEEVELQYAFRIQPENSPLQIESPIPIGTLEYGKKTSIILEFKLSPKLLDKKELFLMRGKITLEVPSLMNPYSRLVVQLRRPIRPDHLVEKPPTSILHAMSRITLYRMQEKARHEVSDGNSRQAARRLQHLATHLLAQGDRELAKTVLMEADHIQRNHQFSKEGEKKIKYGTRALLLLPSPERKLP
jgi:Ca-activated chloride channel homolog